MTELAELRLYNQRVVDPVTTNAAEVVQWLGAVQAQDYKQALWAVGLRTKGATVSDVERAIADGEIVRTWPMRGTLHFVPAQDARWMVELLAPRVDTAYRARFRQLDLDDAVFYRAFEIIGKELRGGKRLTRPELFALFETAGIATANQRGVHILGWAARQGLVCVGPMAGKQSTFVLLDEWAPRQKRPSREEALATLAERYFQSHGPATIVDFAAWSGMAQRDARIALELVGSHFLSEDIEGKQYWFIPASQRPASDVYLLPAFDEYVIGQAYRKNVTEPSHYEQIFSGMNGVIAASVVANGRIVGTWRRVIKTKTVEIMPSLMPDTIIASEKLHRAAKHYAEFLGLALK